MQPTIMQPTTQPVARRLALPLRLLVPALVALVLSATVANAQYAGAPASAGQRTQATRAELESLAVQTEQEAASASKSDVRSRKQAEASQLRQRLRDGDFQPGDRIALTVDTGSAATVVDSFTVQSGRTIVLPALPEISLQGVLRAELQDFLVQQYSRFLRNPNVRAVPLLHVAVLGAVKGPGFYWVPADIPMTDAIMVAGGPTQTANVNGTEVRRGRKLVMSKKEVQRALVYGNTLDQLNFHAGDAIVVEDKPKQRWSEVVRVAAAAVSLALALYAVSRKF